MSPNKLPTSLVVLADQGGTILAAYIPGPISPGAPTSIELVAAEGQVVRTVALPDALTRGDGDSQIFRDYRLQVYGDQSELVLAKERTGQ